MTSNYNTDVKVNTLSTSSLSIIAGANAKMGTATLVAGSKVVANTAVTANSVIFITTKTPGGTVGYKYVSAKVAGTSFTITSASGTDTSTMDYIIVEPA